ncbi:unnamed protein product [Euphydryas editha]|uniref:Uncharacterized protein n=1 Tax=Euphydryas editha TaxID=104508 RepID=A0AAU9UWU3_EUPED|nr:unnamed protein product [Euphydryas editha]
MAEVLRTIWAMWGFNLDAVFPESEVAKEVHILVYQGCDDVFVCINRQDAFEDQKWVSVFDVLVDDEAHSILCRSSAAWLHFVSCS